MSPPKFELAETHFVTVVLYAPDAAGPVADENSGKKPVLFSSAELHGPREQS